jgi:hypothetical protein
MLGSVARCTRDSNLVAECVHENRRAVVVRLENKGLVPGHEAHGLDLSNFVVPILDTIGTRKEQVSGFKAIDCTAVIASGSK